MIKIFRCECRRLLCNKFFIGLLAVLLFYAGQVFYAVALPRRGPYGPFFRPGASGPTWGGCCPLWVGALFFLTFFTSARERRAAVLTAATPADPGGTPWPAALPPWWGVALLCLAALALAALLYARLFGWTDWGSLALPALVILAPPSGVRPGQRLAAGPPAALAALCVDAPPLCPGGPASAGGPGAVERRPVHVLSPDSGDAGPGFLPPGGGLGRQGLLLAAGVLLLLVAGKGKKVYNQ